MKNGIAHLCGRGRQSLSSIEKEGIIFNIQKYSIHDGPGIRTTVFLKGCPLSCWWCHNPESQNFKEEMLFYEKRCIGCGACVEECRKHGVEDPSECFESAEVCYSNAREIAGKRKTVSEVLEEIEKDRVFYESSGGGVTFSGGEPLAQPQFIMHLLKKCKEKNFHTTVDTCGYASLEILNEAANYTDLFLYDLKGMNEKKHIEHTGVSNQLILSNLRFLGSLGKRVFVRVPVIPGLNDSDEELREMAEFTAKFPNVEQVNLLPYHHIAVEKYKRMNKTYMLPNQNEPDGDYMGKKSDIFKNHGINVKIGG